MLIVRPGVALVEYWGSCVKWGRGKKSEFETEEWRKELVQWLSDQYRDDKYSMIYSNNQFICKR